MEELFESEPLAGIYSLNSSEFSLWISFGMINGRNMNQPFIFKTFKHYLIGKVFNLGFPIVFISFAVILRMFTYLQ